MDLDLDCICNSKMFCCAVGSSNAADRTMTMKLSSTRAATSSKASKLSSEDRKPKTIQDDPQATEVFKSLFNTHKTAQQQQHAHWVTYNPQYF